jgi:hypothetical protein
MAQVLIPIADDSPGKWTPTPISPKIKQLLPGDPTFVTSGQNVSLDAFTVKLGGVAWPGSGDQVVNIRLRNTSSTPSIATITLLEGTVAVASWNVQPTTSFTTYPLALTSAQISSINDYTNLHLMVTATTSVCSCTGLPLQITATITNMGGCACLAGSHVLNYVLESGIPTWQGSFTACGQNASIEFGCAPSGTSCFNFTCEVDCGGKFVGFSPSSCTCSPFNFVFTGIMVTGACCTGGITVTFTI